jgi:hypothetical protein
MNQNNQPAVCVRRMFDRDAFGVWFGKYVGEKTLWAKPVKLELEEQPDSWVLPEPTLVIPRLEFHDFFERMAEQAGYEGVSNVRPFDILKAKDENLKDLRSVIDRLFLKT